MLACLNRSKVTTAPPLIASSTVLCQDLILSLYPTHSSALTDCPLLRPFFFLRLASLAFGLTEAAFTVSPLRPRSASVCGQP